MPRLLALAATLVALTLALPALAQAATYCVNSPGCSGTNEPDLQSAFNAAMASTTETDTVQVGNPGPPPGSGYNYSDSGNSANEVHLVGGGTSQTVLTGAPGATVLSVLGPGSSIANLTVQLPDANAGGIGTSGSLSNVNVTSLDSGGHSQTGVTLVGSGSQQWHGGSVTLPTSGGVSLGVGRSGGNGTVDLEDLSIAAQSEGIIASAGDNMTLRRVSVVSGVGIVANGAHATIDNLAFRSVGSPDIFLVVEPNGGNDASADVNHASALGAGLSNGIGLIVSSSTANRAANLSIRNSIVRNFFLLAERTTNGSGTVANIGASYSDIALLHSDDSNFNGGTGTITSGPGMIDSDPLFVNPAAGDISLKLGSPAIDGGDPAGLQAGDSATDVRGAPRIANGRQDMGAFEFQPSPPIPAPAKDTTAPTLKTSKLPKKLTLKRLLAGITFTVVPSEPSSIDATLAGSASSVKLAKNYNLTLAHRKLGLAAGKRRVTLKVRKKLLGHSRRFSVQLTLVATDAAGNKRTLKRTIKVH